MVCVRALALRRRAGTISPGGIIRDKDGKRVGVTGVGKSPADLHPASPTAGHGASGAAAERVLDSYLGRPV